MNVLIVGSGGREHALAWKLRQALRLNQLLIAPGNPGTAALGQNVAVAADDVAGLVALAQQAAIDLVVVGPEVALAAGLVDALAHAEIPCFGPTQAAARIESSKSFSKRLMAQAGVPTCRFEVFADAEIALTWLNGVAWEEWRVAKLDGLAAGKGVVVAGSEAELRATLEQWRGAGQIILEEPLTGEEVSLLAICDGRTALPLLPAQDHKRLGEGDTGPNTGGMGAYAPLPHLAPDVLAEVERTVFAPTLAALAAAGSPFVGVLYAGLMLTPNGPKVLEFNARFGDPEAQVILPLLASDLLEICVASVTGQLDRIALAWHPGAALGVVLAAEQYPAKPRTGDPITLPPPEHGLVFQAGTALHDGHLVTAGGRVLTVVGRGADLAAAQAAAYLVADQISFAGKYCRRDIGTRGLAAERYHG